MPGSPPEPPEAALQSADAPSTPPRPKAIRPLRFGNRPAARRRGSGCGVTRCDPQLTKALRQRQLWLAAARQAWGHPARPLRPLRTPSGVLEGAGARAGHPCRPASGCEAGRIAGGRSHPACTLTPRGSRGRLHAAHAPRSRRGMRTRAEGKMSQAASPPVVLLPVAWGHRRAVRPAPTDAAGAVASCVTAGGSREERPSRRRRDGASPGTSRAID